MKTYLTAVVAIIVLISCKKDFNPSAYQSLSSDHASTTITAEPAGYFDSLFTRYQAGQWTGGDVAYSYKLANGNSLWLFGDSFVDTVYPDRHRPFDAFIHNSMVITDANRNFVTTLYGGTAKKPEPFFKAKDPKIYWPNSIFTTKDTSKLYVLLQDIMPNGEGGAFGFELTGNSIGILSYPSLQLLTTKVISKNPKVDWSSATYEEGNYIYIYGAESVKYNKYVHVMRTKRNNPFKSIEFYNGSTWMKDSSQSARLMGGVSEQFSFFKYNGKYYLLSQGTNLSADIYLWDAASPTGPFTHKRKVYHTPQAGGNIFTYNATAHTEFMDGGKLLVGYCVNSFDGTDMYKNADNYRPYFIWLSNWQ